MTWRLVGEDRMNGVALWQLSQPNIFLNNA
jgi:hypothetical protein